MKRVLVSDAAVEKVNILRDDIGSYEVVKCRIADSVCGLARMISHGLDLNESNVLKYYINDIVDAMDLISDFNELVDNLKDSRDVHLPRYVIEETEDDGNSPTYDYAPNERELEIIQKILEEKNVKLPGIHKIDELTLSEIADAAGMSGKDLHTMVCFRR